MAAHSQAPRYRVPPPLLFLAAFLIALALQRYVPGASAWPHGLRAVGIPIVVIGFGLAVWAIGLFARSRTTIIPHRTSSALVIRGPYRWSRNPMYVAMSIVHLGAAVWTGTWLALPFLVFPLWVLNRLIIPMEEAQLLARFGDAYASYCDRVGRWI